MTAITPIFTIDKITHGEGAITAYLSINKDSEIFHGHFPGQPVVPGACMLQLAKDVLEMALNCPLLLKKAGHLKFISIIDPRIAQTIQLYVSYTFTHDIAVTAQLHCNKTVCFKFQGTFIKHIIS
jgi:3-hydroxyacyl-[acyl-carrier-protein] dehydratase